MSSSSVYGAAETPVHEDSPAEPTTFYGISKLRGEKHIARLAADRKVQIVRCANVYGYSPSMRFDAVVNRFVFEAGFFRRISIHGNGKQRRGFVCIDHVTQTLEQLLEKNIPAGTYNLVDRNLSVLEIGAALKELLPDLEFIFIDQHMPLRNLEVYTGFALKKFISLEERNFDNELREFLVRLAF